MDRLHLLCRFLWRRLSPSATGALSLSLPWSDERSGLCFYKKSGLFLRDGHTLSPKTPRASEGLDCSDGENIVVARTQQPLYVQAALLGVFSSCASHLSLVCLPFRGRSHVVSCVATVKLPCFVVKLYGACRSRRESECCGRHADLTVFYFVLEPASPPEGGCVLFYARWQASNHKLRRVCS